MKQTNWDGKEMLLVEVPEGAYCIDVKRSYGKWMLEYFFDGDDFACNVLPGYWQFAFASPLSPTEQEAGEWVDSFPYLDIYKDYTALENGYEYNLDNAIESLHSRIKSEGFTHPERVVLLTKK